jgi:deazaflavin-dependent oxidoreductase (nitroreductase family)
VLDLEAAVHDNGHAVNLSRIQRKELPMPIPRVIARLNRVGLNRLARRVAPWVPGLGVVIHRGRRTGREYRTPVNVFQASSGVRIALTYGPGCDWVKNVIAAGGCRLHTRGQYLDLTAPLVVHDPARSGIRPLERPVLGLLRVHDFLDLQLSVPSHDTQ